MLHSLSVKAGTENLWTGATLLGLFLLGPSAAAPASAAVTTMGPGPGGSAALSPSRGPALDLRRIRRITRISAELLELDAEALDRVANAYRASAPEDLVLAVLLRAGRPVPPGLAAARRAQREARAAEALGWLERERDSADGRSMVDACIALALAPGGGAAPSIPELQIAASFVVADLELVAQAPSVARLLDEGVTPEVRRGARTALFRMYARVFDDLASFEARWEQLRLVAPALTGRDDLRAAIEERDERSLKLLELAPGSFSGNPLEWEDPSMSERAARTLGRAVAGGNLDPAVARAMLEEDLGAVADPGVLHARLGVLIDLVQGADPQSDAARSLRATVMTVAAASPASGPDFVWVALGALRRLEYPEGAAGDVERVAALRLAAEVFQGALDARRYRPLDPDALQAAVLAMRDVARGVQPDGSRQGAVRLRQGAVRLLMPELRALVTDDGLSLGVRRAAASALTLSSAARDVLQLVDLMRSPATREELGYELLGALKVVAGSLDPGSEAAETVLDRLFEFIAEPDFDRRRLAFELLLSDEFAPLVDEVARPTSARWTTMRLQAEPSQELRLRLLALLARLGDRETLELLLDRAGLVEELIEADPAIARALCEAALAMNGDADPAPMLRLARRVSGPLGEAEALDPARVARLRAGVDLVLGLDPRTVAKLPIMDSRWVVAAAVDLRRAYPVLALGQLDSVERETLSDVHVDRLGAIDDDSEAALVSLARALLEVDALAAELREGPPDDEGADEFAVAERAGRADRALADLDAAMATADAVDRVGWSRVDLSLEGVELLQRLGRLEAARLRAVALFEGESVRAAERSARAVRTLVSLTLEETGGADGEPSAEVRARADLASRALLGLIGQEGWSGELPGTQLGDLEALLRLVVMGEDDAPRAEAVAYLDERFASQADAVIAWRASLEAADAEGFQRLGEALGRARARGDTREVDPGDAGRGEEPEAPAAGAGEAGGAGSGNRA